MQGSLYAKRRMESRAFILLFVSKSSLRKERWRSASDGTPKRSGSGKRKTRAQTGEPTGGAEKALSSQLKTANTPL